MANPCPHEADPLVFLEVIILLRCLGGEFNTLPEQHKELQGLKASYLILTIKHVVMPRFSMPVSHTRTREKNLQ